ncbi:acyl carrier protein [Jannaschia sp. M317]|uniref:acyl carrier protein n=1 Tax=Jannaschia sp. M317 TaxID=2867011 RepID=UPI0021A3DD3E|nr:acyl carrier protein [Jannaschia sp. M317]UWQ16136.1 acyl carrier protein [Jannaschia sp. M317]
MTAQIVIIADRVRNIVADVTSQPHDRVIETAHLVRDLELDSLDMVELAMALEEAFGIDLEDANLESVPTVGALIAVIEART